MKGYPGVSQSKHSHKLKLGQYKDWEINYVYYKARICVNGKSKLLGYFDTKEKAAAAYQAALKKKLRIG